MKGIHLDVLREDPGCFICVQWGGNPWVIRFLWPCIGVLKMTFLPGNWIYHYTQGPDYDPQVFLSQYKVNFKYKTTVQLFHPCTGADFHISGPFSSLSKSSGFLNFYVPYLPEASVWDWLKWRHSQMRDPSIGTSTPNTDGKKIGYFYFYYDLDSPRYSLHIFLMPIDSVKFLVLMSLRRDVFPVFMPFPTWSVCKAWLSD